MDSFFVTNFNIILFKEPPFVQYVFVLIISLIPINHCCLLCYIRLPPRPKSIDHLWFSALDNVNLPETAEEMCSISKNRLPFTTPCCEGLAKIFCNLSDYLHHSWQECSMENNDFDQCANCSLRKMEMLQASSWVVYWLDSLGKMPSAVSEGNYYWLGDYEQCSVLRESGSFDGRYCRILLQIPDFKVYKHCTETNTLNIHFGLCAPAACTPEEIGQFTRMITPYAVNAKCETLLDWSLSSQIFLISLITWLCFLIIGTLIDVYCATISSCKLQRNKLYVLARCISILRNAKIALSTKRSHEYHSVQGLQVLTVSIIVTANCFIYILPYIENVLFSYDSLYHWQLHPLNNFSYHIDALIAINTLFTSLLLQRKLENTDAVKKLYFKRLLQVLPAYAFIILFMTFLYDRLSSGPIWMHGDLIMHCKVSWWKNLLFINNFFSANHTCLDGGYLFSLQAQFFLLLLPMLYLSKRFYTTVLAVAVSTFLASIIYIFYQVLTTNLPPTVLLTSNVISSETFQTYIDLLMTKPWARAPAFLIGFLFSFLFTRQKSINKASIWLIQLVLILLGFLVVFGLYPYAIGNSPAQVLLAAYSSLHRPIWAFILCSLVFFGYLNKNNGSISKFFEWRVFSPLAKNTFIVFIVSEPVSLYLFSSVHRPLHATLWTLLNIAIGTIILSHVVAFLLIVLTSMPIKNIVLLKMSETEIFDVVSSDDANNDNFDKSERDCQCSSTSD
ncbi:unnamed protein product [Thelazia callipaeda]|uniref:NRF domain-containing protein n=1 Tax=Thelazia callipaeda TaxID=103827 RepID=A0A0N5D5Y6_THECL|nr:unnamed protein product [Thelazia callipaeda]